MTFASGGGSLRNGKVSIPRSIGQWAPRDGDGGGPATNRFFGSGRRNREKETYLRTSVRGRPRAHSRTLARNTQHLRLLRGSLRGERVLRGGRDAQSVRPSVGRQQRARGRFLCLLPSSASSSSSPLSGQIKQSRLRNGDAENSRKGTRRCAVAVGTQNQIAQVLPSASAANIHDCVCRGGVVAFKSAVSREVNEGLIRVKRVRAKTRSNHNAGDRSEKNVRGVRETVDGINPSNLEKSVGSDRGGCGCHSKQP